MNQKSKLTGLIKQKKLSVNSLLAMRNDRIVSLEKLALEADDRKRNDAMDKLSSLTEQIKFTSEALEALDGLIETAANDVLLAELEGASVIHEKYHRAIDAATKEFGEMLSNIELFGQAFNMDLRGVFRQLERDNPMQNALWDAKKYAGRSVPDQVKKLTDLRSQSSRLEWGQKDLPAFLKGQSVKLISRLEAENA